MNSVLKLSDKAVSTVLEPACELVVLLMEHFTKDVKFLAKGFCLQMADYCTNTAGYHNETIRLLVDDPENDYREPLISEARKLLREKRYGGIHVNNVAELAQVLIDKTESILIENDQFPRDNKITAVLTVADELIPRQIENLFGKHEPLYHELLEYTFMRSFYTALSEEFLKLEDTV